jgi:type I restriction enzyme S subunit
VIDGLKPYPAMKKSGVPWLGAIPEHWGIKRAKAVFRCIDVRSPSGEEELLTVSSDRGVVPRSSATVTMFKADSYVGYKLCWPGDLVINSLWAWARGLGVSRHHGIVSSAYGVYRLRLPYKDYAEFIDHLVRSTPFNWELQVRSKGIWISRLQLTDEAFLGAPFPIPPAQERDAIVRFLDYADRRIRRYIRAKQKLIKLLGEQKQAIIHRAVTRGLDPNVRLKPSGVEWLGEVPEHWEVVPLKRVGTVRIGLTYSPGDVCDESGTLVLRASNIRNGQLIHADDVHVSRHVPKTLRVRKDDILICVRSGSRNLVGKSALITAEFDGVSYGAFMSLLRTIDNKFYYRVLNSNLLPTVMAQFETSTINQLTQNDLRSLVVPIPPEPERAAINDFLDAETTNADAAVSSRASEIKLLREYRTRLIADVVTGKLDVREAAARLPNEPEDLEPLDDAVTEPDGDETAADEADEAPEEAEA